METYELTYIITPEASSQEAETIAKDIETFLQSKEGTVVKQTAPEAKALAYPVAGKASGFYGVIEFTLEQDKVAELNEKLQKDKKFSRHMITVKTVSKPKKTRRGAKPVEETAAPAPEAKEEIKTEEPASVKDSGVAKEEAPKVDLKDIDQQLDEILG